MNLIYGTTNKSKILFMKMRVEPLGINILSLNDIGAPKLDIDESGNSPLENAKIKALEYYRELKQPVFTCDSGLYIDGIDDARQPSVHVRGRGDYMNDDEVVSYYSSLAAEFGGNMTARYQNAICLVLDSSRIYEYMGEDIAGEDFCIVSKPHDKRKGGFPLDSLSVDKVTGKYYYDIDGYGEEYCDNDGFTQFFQRVLQDKYINII